MIIQFHTPTGIVKVDSDTVTDAKLAEISMDRQKLNAFLSIQPRDMTAEMDDLKRRLAELESPS